jgi:hypothetical protein
VDNSECCGNGVAGKIVIGKDDLSPTVPCINWQARAGLERCPKIIVHLKMLSSFGTANGPRVLVHAL